MVIEGKGVGYGFLPHDSYVGAISVASTFQIEQPLDGRPANPAKNEK